jgi:hypothetical protein
MFKNKLRLIIIIVFVLLFVNEIYKQIIKKQQNAKSSRLICQTKTVTFEKVLKQNLIKKLQQTLKSGDYQIKIWADKSRYMKSVLFDYINIENIKKDFKAKISNFKTTIVPSKSADIFVDIMIYENDKKDPGKKTARSKLYVGYIEVAFIVDKQIVYKIQTDFINSRGKDIPQRITCIVNSVMTLNNKLIKKD